MLTDRDITTEFKDNYRYANDYWGPFVSCANVSTLASSGYTWSDKERIQLSKEGREPLEFNIMKRPLQFYSGYLRDNLNSVIYAPVEGSDQQTADQFTKLSYYIWDKGGGYETFLGACDEAFKSGINLCGIEMDYSKDFVHGDISFFSRTYNSFYLDPTFSKINMTDCAFAITRDLIDKSMVFNLLPFVDKKEIEEIPGSYKDDKFLSYSPQFSSMGKHRNLVTYDQYYRRTTRKRKFLVDDETGYYKDVSDLDKDELDRLKVGVERIKQMHEEGGNGLGVDGVPHMVHFETVERPYIELHVMVNGKLVYSGEDRTGVVETYPFAPILCYFEPSIWMGSLRVQGISQSLYSTQRQFNKRHMKIIDMMDTQISTGYKYLIGSVPDVEDLQQSGQNRLIGVDPDPSKAPQGLDSVQELKGGDANPALMEYQKILDDLMLELSNINESVLGVDEKGNTQISGRLAQVRIAQGLRGNRKIFDNVEISQRVLGGLILKAIQNNYTPGKVQRILGEEPTEQFYEKQFEQYDAVVKEGVRSQSQRDAYYYELVNLKREQIVDVPESEIIKAMQMAGMSDLQKAIEEGQAERAKKQAEMEEASKKLVDAQAEEKLALAKERNTRSLANIGLEMERESEQVQNLAQAQLDKARAIVEISQMSDQRIIEALRVLNEIQAGQREELMQSKVESVVKSESQKVEGESKPEESQGGLQ